MWVFAYLKLIILYFTIICLFFYLYFFTHFEIAIKFYLTVIFILHYKNKKQPWYIVNAVMPPTFQREMRTKYIHAVFPSYKSRVFKSFKNYY